MLWQEPENYSEVSVGAIDEFNRQKAQQTLMSFRTLIQQEVQLNKYVLISHLESIRVIMNQQIRQTDAKLQRPDSVMEARRLEPVRKRLSNLSLLLETYYNCVKHELEGQESDCSDQHDNQFLKGLCNEIFFVLQTGY
ncbi:MAG: hypothetical protein EP332_06245 [Bacteroidetes bacterium]|nr:MAG: hypothetical protein EP332_06245 [Bacteroidota bacterium]